MLTMTLTKTSDLCCMWPDEMRSLDFRFAYDTHAPNWLVQLPITLTVWGIFRGRRTEVCVAMLNRIHVYTTGGDA